MRVWSWKASCMSSNGSEEDRDMKKSFIYIIMLAALILLLPAEVRAEGETARRLDVTLSSGGGKINDGSYNSKADFAAGSSLTVSVPEGEEIGGIYLVWSRIPGEWTMVYGDNSGNLSETICGRNGFLHEYVSIEDGGIRECTLRFDTAVSLCDIYVYSPGKLPEDVQQWRKPCEDGADFLVFSTHADDECLFLGGAIATYAGARDLRCQVVYMTTYWDLLPIREHEKLDGLWTMGVKYYPVNSVWTDEYAGSLEEAERIYDHSAITEFFTEQLRRFKPQVVISQDFNGEYGHGAHILLAACVAEAVDNGMDAGFCPDSAVKYGVWDTPKAYFHLYRENRITMNLRQPIASLGGMTAVEAAAAAYLKHVSQQWCWYYVSDDPNDPKADKINCAEFGLYRSTVGSDSGNDMMENVTSYEDQEKAKLAEEARIAEEKRLADKAKAEEEARIKEEQRRAELVKVKEEAEEERGPGKISAASAGVGLLVMLLLSAGVFVYAGGRRQ